MAQGALALSFSPGPPAEPPTGGLRAAVLLGVLRQVALQIEAKEEVSEHDLEAARALRSMLRSLREAQQSYPTLLTEAERNEMEELYDRVDELVDTLIWATEGRELLLERIEAELCD